MIVVKTHDEIEKLKVAGAVAGEILKELRGVIKPGISTMEINDRVEHFIVRHGQKAGFKGYGGFPYAACISVNEEVVHGFPSKKRILKEGDIVSVDLGSIYEGFYSDAARTYPVGRISELHQKLIDTCRASFFEGLKYCKKGCRVGDISHAIQERVEADGFSIIRDYTGHGVGRSLHEDPPVPNYGRADHGPQLVPGMVIAVEPMIAEGDYYVDVADNGWTAYMLDGGFAAHYENSVVITEDEPMLLTCMDE